MLDGCDLEWLVRAHGPLPAGRALYLLRQICRSLAEAHAKGHRDVKPANVYVCRMGLEFDFVKVLDFGLVTYETCAPEAPTLTGQAMTMGTPAYSGCPDAIRARGTGGRRSRGGSRTCRSWRLRRGICGDRPCTPRKRQGRSERRL